MDLKSAFEKVGQNYKVFELRSNLRLITFILVTVIFLGVGSWIFLSFNSEKGFLFYHDRKEYKPLYTTGNSGFYGKVNYYLNLALLDTNRVDKLTVDNLNIFYKRLKFFYPSDSSDYLPRNDEFRLIGFVPDSTNKEEVNFFYNSEFIKTISQQSDFRHLTDRLFNIEFEKEGFPRIKKIEIDTTRLNMMLSFEYWNGTIGLNDPYAAIDSSLLYLYGQGGPLPLFSLSENMVQSFRHSACQYLTFNFPFMNEKLDFYDIFMRSQSEQLPVKIQYDNNRNSIRILNTKDSLFLDNQNQDHLRIIINDRDTIKENRLQGFSRRSLATGLKLSIKFKDHTINDFYITVNGPYSSASIPVNGSIKGSRFRMAKINSDVSLWQQMRVLEAVMEKKDSSLSLKISGNPVLSKYLEVKMMQYVRQLKSDSSICRQDEDDDIEMSVCLLDASTGEVIADPYFGNYFDVDNINEVAARKNFNLELHDIGSTFKPLLYLASSLKFPALHNFILNGNPTTVSSDTGNTKLIGYKTDLYGWKHDARGKPVSAALPFWSYLPIDRKTAIRISHDNYPIATALLSLTEDNDQSFRLLSDSNHNNQAVNDFLALNQNTNTARISSVNGKLQNLKDLSQSSFYKLLQYLYDVQIIHRESDKIYDSEVYPDFPAKKVNFLSPELTSLFDSTFQGNLGYSFNNFRTDILGQGNNKWSNIKLAESYARILSLNRVEATFLKRPNNYKPSELLTDNLMRLYNNIFGDTTAMRNAWKIFKTDWISAVREKGTLLYPADTTFRTVFRQNAVQYNLPNGLEFYCKTGTPQENIARRFIYGNQYIYFDEGLFAFGIVTPGNNVKGITGIVYIKHMSRKPIIKEPGTNTAKGVESKQARNFLASEVFRNILFYCKNRFR